MTIESPILGTYKRAPVEFVRGRGVHLYDAEGTAYLDFVSGIAVNALGYDDAGLKSAMHAAADGLVHTSNLYSTSPGERLAAALVAKSFAEKVFFCNSGAEANEGAFKFARRWARTKGDAKHEIVALRGAFHGRLFGTLAATDRPAYRVPFRPLTPGVSIFERDLAELDVTQHGSGRGMLGYGLKRPNPTYVHLIMSFVYVSLIGTAVCTMPLST